MKVNNWEVWQSFRKDRGAPPWIKLHRNLFSNPEWMELSDSEKGQLISIWLLAADKGGTIPDSPVIIQKMCMLDSLPNINKFIDLQFLRADDSQVVVKARSSDGQEWQHASRIDAPEESRGEESRVDQSGKPKRFAIPAESDVIEYMTERGGNKNEALKFIDFYSSKGWLVGKVKMKDWKASVRNWTRGKEAENKNEPKRKML